MPSLPLGPLKSISAGLVVLLAVSATGLQVHGAGGRTQAAPEMQNSTQAPSPAQSPSATPKSGSVTCAINAETSPPLPPALAAARDLYRTGKFEEATAAYKAILPSGGADAAAAYAGLARVYLKQKRVADADDAAQKAVALTPERAPAIVALGEVYFRQGKLTQAQHLFLAPLLACHLDARAFLGLTRLYIANLDFKTADRYIRQAFKLDPGDPDIRRQYVDFLEGDERIAFLKKYLEDATDDDADTRRDMQIGLGLLEAEKKEGEHSCKLTSQVTQTETRLEPLLDDPQHLRGVGLIVRVNGVPGRLMLDTGASGVLVDKKIADKAGVRKLADHDVEGIGDKKGAAGYLGYAEKIQIGELQFEDCYVTVVNKRSVLDDDGLIGADVFRSFLVDVNMPDKKFKLTQLPPYPEEAGVTPAQAGLQTSENAHHALHDRYVPPEMKDFAPILLFGHNMVIPTLVNKKGPNLFIVDSGAWDSMVDSTLAKTLTKLSLDQDTEIRGLSGKVEKVYRTRNVTLQFSHFQQKRDDLVAFDLTGLSDNVETEVGGLLGFTLLSMLDMKIDYRDGLVNFTFDPNRFH
jgi:tetratricopeptide (TPR) repeat protein